MINEDPKCRFTIEKVEETINNLNEEDFGIFLINFLK
jgi:hypothetical protein